MNLRCMELQPATKNLNLYPIIGMNGLSINQLGSESNSVEIGSQVGRVNTHCAMVLYIYNIITYIYNIITYTNIYICVCVCININTY